MEFAETEGSVLLTTIPLKMSARLLKKVLKEQEELQQHYSQSSTTEDGQDPGPSSPTASSINPFDLLIDDEDDSQINPQQVSYFIPLYNFAEFSTFHMPAL